MHTKHFFLALATLLLPITLGWGVEIRKVSQGPIHEALITPITGPLPLHAITHEPPPPLIEQVPGLAEGDQAWIPGYWFWSDPENDFIWVSGVWRLPPPSRTWVPGDWKYLEEGWVWLQGFWSAQPKTQLQFIPLTPPDPLDENISQAPEPNQFWASGYWSYNSSMRNYEWVGGIWENFDAAWVYVPNTYVWRPEGWIFVSSYWDWPAALLGKAYACVWIPTDLREKFVYEPFWVLESRALLENCYSAYPDYLYWCHHHWHHNPHFWNSCGCTPTWWHWDQWWCMSWHNQWAIWWWWAHPGYPHPVWLTKHAADLIVPAKQTVFEWAKKTTPPAIVLPNGVVSPQNLTKALDQILQETHEKPLLPILPPHKKILQKIQNKALTKTVVPHNILKPEGKPGDWQTASKNIQNLPLVSSINEKQPERHLQLPQKNLLPNLQTASLKPQIEETPHPKPEIRKITPYLEFEESLSDPQDRIERLQKYHQYKQIHRKQRHEELLEKIRGQHQEEQLQLLQKNEQKMQILKQKQEDHIKQIQIKQKEKERVQQIKHKQKLEFQKQQQIQQQQQQEEYLRQMQFHQQKLEQRHQQIDHHQEQLEQLQRYKNQQEQQREERMKRLQRFKPLQAIPQTPYHPKISDHRR